MMNKQSQDSQSNNEVVNVNEVVRRPRTRDDFIRFCNLVLEYENYDLQLIEDEALPTNGRTTPPLDSSGSSEYATSSGQEDKASDEDSDNDEVTDKSSYGLVTCYCRKPFAGRPMIECSNCLTWVHLSCARIRRTNIPDVFICALCKQAELEAQDAAASAATSAPNRAPANLPPTRNATRQQVRQPARLQNRPPAGKRSAPAASHTPAKRGRRASKF